MSLLFVYRGGTGEHLVRTGAIMAVEQNNLAGFPADNLIGVAQADQVFGIHGVYRRVRIVFLTSL